jgi:hypothetical protein
MTGYIVLYCDGTTAAGDIDWPDNPSLAQIKALVEPIVGEPMEHVRVLDPDTDEYRDMFVDEMGHQHDRPHNAAATALYRNNWLVHEGGDPDDLPSIVGNAVVFDREVWR